MASSPLAPRKIEPEVTAPVNEAAPSLQAPTSLPVATSSETSVPWTSLTRPSKQEPQIIDEIVLDEDDDLEEALESRQAPLAESSQAGSQAERREAVKEEEDIQIIAEFPHRPPLRARLTEPPAHGIQPQPLSALEAIAAEPRGRGGANADANPHGYAQTQHLYPLPPPYQRYVQSQTGQIFLPVHFVQPPPHGQGTSGSFQHQP